MGRVLGGSDGMTSCRQEGTREVGAILVGIQDVEAMVSYGSPGLEEEEGKAFCIQEDC